MGGQGIFFCREHSLPLSTDYFKSQRKGSMPKNTGEQQICTRKSAWRCPEKNVLRPFVRLISVNFVTLTIRFWSTTRLLMMQSTIAAMKKQLRQKNLKSSRKTICQERASGWTTNSNHKNRTPTWMSSIAHN